jgi:hypothetical protein
MANQSTGHITTKTRNKIVIYSVIIAAIYFVCFAFLSSRTFKDWSLWPFFESMIGVFMGAGAIAIITGIILVVQSIIESERDKKQKVFDQKLALYSGIISQMEDLYRLKEDEDVPMIDPDERTNLFFTQLKVALLARPRTFRSFSQLINDIADENGIIKEEATRLLLDFVIDARDDLDVQEEMTSEDQKSLNESIAIAEKAASDIQRTGRGTYFVGDDPFKQYVDQYLSTDGRKSIRNMPKYLWEERPAVEKLEAINIANQYLIENYGGRDGASFSCTVTGGLSGFALGKQRGSKWCYLRFDLWRGPANNQKTSELPTLYLLKSPRNGYEVPRLEGVITCQSPHGYAWFLLHFCRPEQLNNEVRELIEDSYETLAENQVLSEKKDKKEMYALYKQDLERYENSDIC